MTIEACKVRNGIQCPQCGCKADGGICQNYVCEGPREGGIMKARKINRARVRNMRRYDRGTFITKSRTRDGDHVVDIEELTCTCEGFSNYGTCEHLKKAIERKTEWNEKAKPITISLV